jgi:hypothetical protein
MVLTTKEVSCIIVLGIVRSVLPISSKLLQDSYHVCLKQKIVNKREEQPIKQRGSPQSKRAQSIYFPTAFLIAFPVSIPIPFS